MGTLKFISGNPGFLNEMISKGTVEILINLIKQINENTKKCGTCLPNSGHLLVQVSTLLEKVRYVRLAFMLPNTSYLPGGCNREQVVCYLRPRRGALPQGSQAAATAPPPPRVCPFPVERLFHGFSQSSSPHACGHSFPLPCRESLEE